MATYRFLLAVEEILDGRLEFDEANRHGSGLGSVSVSEGILDFRVDTKHGIESRSRSRAKIRDIERTRRYSSEARNSSKNCRGASDESWRVFEALIVPRLDCWLGLELNELPRPRWRLARTRTNRVSLSSMGPIHICRRVPGELMN